MHGFLQWSATVVVAIGILNLHVMHVDGFAAATPTPDEGRRSETTLPTTTYPETNKNPRPVGTARWSFESSPSDPSAQQRMIQVCWERDGAPGHAERVWAEDQVNRTWGAHAAIRFVGWSTCAHAARGVRILLHRTNAFYVSTVGRNLDGVQNGVTLGAAVALSNRTWSNEWIARCAPDVTDARAYEKCFRWQVTHVFGHVLGVLHAPTSRFKAKDIEFCRLGLTDTPEDFRMFFTRDEAVDAVMSPCPSDRSLKADNVELTAWDIARVRALYCESEHECDARQSPTAPP